MCAAAAKRTALAAVSVLVVVAMSILVPAGGASSDRRDHESPTKPGNVRVTSATQSLVRVAWDPSTDNVGVEGYYVFGDKGKATVDAPEHVDAPEYSVTALACGQSAEIGVVAYDGSRNRSEKAEATVSTAPCLDTQPPSAPSNFRQVATTQDAVVLGWSASWDDVGVVEYGVYRNLLRVAAPAEPTVALAGLLCGSTYDYTVDALDAAGNRSPRATVFVRTAPCPVSLPSGDTTPPSQPTGLAASNRTQTSLSLSWNASTDNVAVTGYDVHRNGTKMATLTSTSASQTGLACGTSYTFAVVARDAAGNSSSQAQLTAATTACSTPPPPPPGDTTPPSQPTGLAASNRTQTSLSLSWNASTDNVAVTGYDVHRNGTKMATLTSTSASQTGLACGTSYTFAVVARDAAGNSSSQAQLTAATTACSTPTPTPTPPPPSPGDTTPPSQPSNLAITSASRTSVSLAWSSSTDNVGVAGYQTYVDGSSASVTLQPGDTRSNLDCGTAYTFEVDAFDTEGNYSTKAAVTGSTAACADTQPPSAPSDLVATSRTATSIALSWSASSDNVGVAGYALYRGGAQVGTSSGNTGIFSGLSCNTNYTLAVDAYDAASNHSSKVTVMVSTTVCPDTTPPSAPSGVAASNVTGTSLTLSWNASTDNVGVTGYDVYKDGARVANVSSPLVPQTGLACATSYSFGVVARDAAGNASSTASLNVSTAGCPAPTWTSSIADGQSVQAGATWTVTVNPTPDSVEFWATPVGGASTKLKTDTSAPYDVTLNLASGSYILAVCSVQGTVRTCFADRKNVTIAASSPPSPSASSPYFVADYANGTFGTPWSLLFSHSSPGWVNLPASQSPDGRVKVVPAPSGSGNAARFELRDSDPGWPSNPDVQKAEVRTDTEPTFNKSAVSVGDVRWFSTRIYLPYNATEKFELAHGGSQPFTGLLGLHTGSSTGWGAFRMVWEAYQVNAGNQNLWANFNVCGGATMGENTNCEMVRLWQLTDGSGNRVLANANRWIDLVWGMRFAPDSTGWLEAWVDGVNVYPRKNRPTMWAGDTGQYFKYGLYKRKDASFPETGRSVVYFGRTTIGLTKP